MSHVRAIGILFISLGLTGCAPKCGSNSVLLTITFPDALRTSLAATDQLTVRVGSNPSTPTTIPAGKLVSGAQITIDLHDAYQSHHSADLDVIAWQAGTPIAGGATQLTLGADCTVAAVALSQDLAVAAGPPDPEHVTIEVTPVAATDGGASPIFVADGTPQARLTITVADSSGIPIVNEPVTLTVEGPLTTPSDSRNLIDAPAPTDSAGRTTVTLGSIIGEVKLVTATVRAISKSVQVGFDPAPPVIVQPPSVIQGGTSNCFVIGFQLAQVGSQPASVVLEYDDGIGFRRVSDPAHALAMVLATSPQGTAHSFLWDSNLDLVGSKNVRIRVTPSIGSVVGAAQTSAAFSVSNDAKFTSIAVTAAQAVVTGDFDGDGRADVVVSGSGGSATLLGIGAGYFRVAANFPGNTSARSMAVGDFNGDHRLDVVAVGGAGSDVLILIGNGDGTFHGAPNVPAVAPPSAITAADFDGDGKLDFVVSLGGWNKVSLMLGNGDGTFRATGDFSTGFNALSVVAGDLNGDGKPDLVVANYLDNSAGVLLGNGSGSFQAMTSFSTGNHPTEVLLGDVNADGIVDIVATLGASKSVSVLLGKGDGTFQSATAFAVASGLPFASALGDFNGDGKIDIATADPPETTGSSSVNLFWGNGDGTFQTAVSVSVEGSPISIASADFDGDGKLDLVTANKDSNDVDVLLQGGGGALKWAGHFPAAPGLDAVTVGDVNGDGKPDLVASLDSGIGVLLANGNATFQVMVTYPTLDRPNMAVLVDLNGDGKLDVATASANLGVLLGKGDGTFQAATYALVPSQPFALTFGDVNGDGKPDLVVAESPGILAVLLGKGDGTFQAPTSLTVGNFAYGFGNVIARDLNGDGRLDLAAVVGAGVSVLLGNGDGTFQPATTFATGTGPAWLAAGDFNGDGKLDLATANEFDLSILFGFGDGTFHPPISVPNQLPGDISAGDFNHDGKLDLAVGGTSISVLLGNGDGTFQASGVNLGSLPGGGSDSIAVGDLNGDGNLDIASALGADGIGVILNLQPNRCE